MLASTPFSSELQYSAQTQHVFPLAEAVKVAGLLSQGVSSEQVRHKVLEEDLFELRSISSRKGALRKTLDRLEPLETQYIDFLAHGHADLRRLTLFFVVLKEHRLLQELVAELLLNQLQGLQRIVSATDLRCFFEGKRHDEAVLSGWSDATFQKAASNTVLALVRAGLLQPIKPRGSYEIRSLPLPQELKQQLIADGYGSYLRLLLN